MVVVGGSILVVCHHCCVIAFVVVVTVRSIDVAPRMLDHPEQLAVAYLYFLLVSIIAVVFFNRETHIFLIVFSAAVRSKSKTCLPVLTSMMNRASSNHSDTCQ